MIHHMKINDTLKELYIQKGFWGEKSLSDYWTASANAFSDREFIVDDRGNRYTYADMDEKASALAAYLKSAGVTPLDVVSFQVPVWSEFVMIVIACLKVGAVIHPIGMCFENEELFSMLSHVGSKIYLCPALFGKRNYQAQALSVRKNVKSIEQIIIIDGLHEKRFEQMPFNEILESYEPLPDSEKANSTGYDIALILCTSGTTQRNKSVLFTHNNILFSELFFNREINLTKDDTMFMPAPLNHATGFHHGIISPMLLGARTVLQQRFNPRAAIDLMNEERCTYSMGATPFMYDILKELKENGGNLPFLKFYLCGGAPVSQKMVRQAFNYGIKVCEVYGSTESVPHAFVRPDEVLALDGSVSGRAMEGVEIKIVDENGAEVPRGTPGEELSRGPNVFVGYLGDREATDKALDDDGWYYSGDICVMDEDGYIKVVGRKKDMIVRGGENLNSIDIDQNIEGCPHVLDHAVIGMPDERLGERICAYVVLDNQSVNAMDILLEYLQSKKIPKRYWPERVEVIDKIPRTDSGKVMKYVLKEDIKSRG